MPFTEAFPFKRIFVDHMVLGTTRVWWQLSGSMTDPGPYSFQLQFSYAGLPSSPDWVDVGSPVVNNWMATDSERRLRGKLLTAYYRIKLTTGKGSYVSNPAEVYGLMPQEDWALAREIVRKEVLRANKVGRTGYLLKRIRYGELCTRCRDTLTGEITDGRCDLCKGTGYLTGYHPATPLVCWDISPETIDEEKREASGTGQIRNAKVKARVLGFPDVHYSDVWVDGHSDQRWYLSLIERQVEIRGMPIVVNVTMELAPFTDAIYRVPVDESSVHDSRDGLPPAGEGCIAINQDYGGENALSYTTAEGCGIAGATIKAYAVADYDNDLTGDEYVLATTTTMANGWWTYELKLDAGDYVLVYEKQGEYGPDAMPITVVAEEEITTEAMTTMTTTAAVAPERANILRNFGL